MNPSPEVDAGLVVARLDTLYRAELARAYERIAELLMSVAHLEAYATQLRAQLDQPTDGANGV